MHKAYVASQRPPFSFCISPRSRFLFLHCPSFLLLHSTCFILTNRTALWSSSLSFPSSPVQSHPLICFGHQFQHTSIHPSASFHLIHITHPSSYRIPYIITYCFNFLLALRHDTLAVHYIPHGVHGGYPTLYISTVLSRAHHHLSSYLCLLSASSYKSCLLSL
jgi:hypothetical protein